MTSTESQTGYAEWSVIELMGHRRLGGFVREVQVAGAGFFRVDVPGDNEGETHSTQFYPPSSVYCLTPVSEQAARIVARSSRPEPVTRWELPQPLKPVVTAICPGCKAGWRVGLDSAGLCSHCGETHPCSCMDEEEAELVASRRGYEFNGEGKTDRDDF